jgi:PKHD-type hydroxylase
MKIDETQNLTTLSNYWSWEDGLSPELCDLLLKNRKEIKEGPGVIGTDGLGVVNTSTRDSKVCWAPVNHWAEGILYNYGLYATQEAGWNFQLGRPEQIQLTSYDKDEFYGWHEDWAPFAPGPSIRKVSVIALLSDPSEFEGGEFQFQEDVNIEMKRGTVIAFPSFVRHQVTPVTSGKRYSAVCWINGPRTF